MKFLSEVNHTPYIDSVISDDMFFDSTLMKNADFVGECEDIERVHCYIYISHVLTKYLRRLGCGSTYVAM